MFRKIIKHLKNPKQFLINRLIKNSKYIPVKIYLNILFKFFNGYKLNLNNPKTFLEKIQWLKIYDKNPEYTKMVDKIEVKNYVSEKIGKEYIIPTLKEYNTVDEIKLEELPSKFVMKCNHDSGKILLCNDKSTLEINKIKNDFKRLLNKDFYQISKEWPYKNVKRKILIEEYINDGEKSDLDDYKWYCFNGEPLYCQVIRDRRTNETIDFYDKDWIHQEFVGLNPKCDNGKKPAKKPENLSKHLEIARILSKDIPFIRVDLYEVNGKIYFGELTFYPNGGFGKFKPSIWDLKLGNLISLPNKK